MELSAKRGLGGVMGERGWEGGGAMKKHSRLNSWACDLLEGLGNCRTVKLRMLHRLYKRKEP